jgi:hypothetical protein
LQLKWIKCKANGCRRAEKERERGREKKWKIDGICQLESSDLARKKEKIVKIEFDEKKEDR